jgi:rhodanese-related sulfurtransferase
MFLVDTYPPTPLPPPNKTQLQHIARPTHKTQACGAGRRAARAAALLADAGYENLRLFKEGFTGWKAAGLPVEKGE